MCVWLFNELQRLNKLLLIKVAYKYQVPQILFKINKHSKQKNSYKMIHYNKVNVIRTVKSNEWLRVISSGLQLIFLSENKHLFMIYIARYVWISPKHCIVTTQQDLRFPDIIFLCWMKEWMNEHMLMCSFIHSFIQQKK